MATWDESTLAATAITLAASLPTLNKWFFLSHAPASPSQTIHYIQTEWWFFLNFHIVRRSGKWWREREDGRYLDNISSYLSVSGVTNGVMDVLRTLIEPLDLPGLPEDTRTGLEYMMRRLALQSPVTITLPVLQLTIIFFISYFCTSPKQTEFIFQLQVS